MADRTIHVDLKANVADFRRQMGAARDSLGDLEKRAGGAEKAAGTAMASISPERPLVLKGIDQPLPVFRVREALAPVQRSQLIETVRGAGYRLTQQLTEAAA